MTQHVNQLRRRSGSTHDAEHGQQGVPYDQRPAQLESAIKKKKQKGKETLAMQEKYSGKVPRSLEFGVFPDS